jgi:hypothetical protein
MEETLEMLVVRCGRMDKEEEAVKRRWLELSPPEIWQMTPEEVVKTALMLNRNGELRPFDELIPLETIDQIRNYLWDITGMI